MANDLREVLRIRELRARLAQSTALRTRQALTRAEALVVEAHRRKESHEQLAQHAAAMASVAVLDSGTGVLAGEAHRLLEFAAGSRFKAREHIAVIRRAELVRERAQEEADESSNEYRRLAMRREAVSLQSQRRQRAALARQREREEEAHSEEHTTLAVVFKLADQPSDSGDDRGVDG